MEAIERVIDGKVTIVFTLDSKNVELSRSEVQFSNFQKFLHGKILKSNYNSSNYSKTTTDRNNSMFLE